MTNCDFSVFFLLCSHSQNRLTLAAVDERGTMLRTPNVSDGPKQLIPQPVTYVRGCGCASNLQYEASHLREQGSENLQTKVRYRVLDSAPLFGSARFLSSAQARQRNAFDEVTLREEEQNDDRQNHQRRSCHHQAGLAAVLRLVKLQRICERHFLGR